MYCINFSEVNTNIKERLEVSPFIHPTNSCYWFWGSIYREEVYNKIFELKDRDVSKPFFITVKDIESIEGVGTYDPRIADMIQQYPNTTFTFILQRSWALPKYINPGIQTVWVQIAKWPLRELFRCIDSPIFWTSANISWQEPIYVSEEVKEAFWDKGDLIFLDGWDLEKQSPSTIIDLTWSEYKILRWEIK